MTQLGLCCLCAAAAAEVGAPLTAGVRDAQPAWGNQIPQGTSKGT